MKKFSTAKRFFVKSYYLSALILAIFYLFWGILPKVQHLFEVQWTQQYIKGEAITGRKNRLFFYANAKNKKTKPDTYRKCYYKKLRFWVGHIILCLIFFKIYSISGEDLLNATFYDLSREKVIFNGFLFLSSNTDEVENYYYGQKVAI